MKKKKEDFFASYVVWTAIRISSVHLQKFQQKYFIFCNSRLSLSRTLLSGITAYLEVKIWSLI